MAEMHLPAGITSVLDGALEYVYSLQGPIESTVVLVPPVFKEMTATVADAIGMDLDTVTYVLALFLCYPLGMLMNFIPYGQARHFASFLFGAFLLQYVLGVQWIHQFISAVVAYIMILVLPRKTLKTALPIFAMVYMTLGHLHRQYVNYLGWDLDFTGCQMVITQKLYMIGYNLYDGELLAKGKEDRAAKKCAPFALKSPPSPIEFLGYCFCFSNILAGPATEYSLYAHCCDGSLFNGPDGKPKGKLPSQIWPTLRCLFVSLICMGAFVGLSGTFPLLDPVDPQRNTPVVLSEDFLKNNLFYRYAYLWIGLLGVRQKYYFGWMNAEGACNIWYAGFKGFNEKGESLGFGAASNVDILRFELAPDVQNMTKEWNKKTSNWLNRYVYIRTGGSLLAVYSMSAFWHGFYPGYYMFFLSVPIITFCDRFAKKKLSPYFSKDHLSIYGIVGTLATTISVNYMISSFIMLAGSWSWQLWTAEYFFGHALSLLYLVVLMNMPTPKDKKKAA